MGDGRQEEGGWALELRFVLLFHECPTSLGKPSHWDLLLEREGAFDAWNLWRLPVSWRVALGRPTHATDDSPQAPADVCPAVELPRHRLHYLDYEGPLTGNRGTVSRCDRGAYRVIARTSRRLEIELSGERLRGGAVLVGNGSGGDPPEWELRVAE